MILLSNLLVLQGLEHFELFAVDWMCKTNPNSKWKDIDTHLKLFSIYKREKVKN